MRNSEAGRALYAVMNRGRINHWSGLPEIARKTWAEQERQVVDAVVGADLNACQLAIVHVLARIKSDGEVRFHFGPATPSFDLLTKAFARLSGEPVAEIRERIIPGSGAIPH